MFESMPDRARLMEVGPRDGLQNEKIIIPTAEKLSFIEALFDAGHQRVEITAFVNPRWIPPLADHQEVASLVPDKGEGARTYAALVPNMRGYENARNTRVSEIAFVAAASESHNQKNLNASTAEVMARYVEVVERCREDDVPFRGYVSCAFGCPYEGDIDVGAVVAVAERMLEFGAYEISIGDTIGVGNPKQTFELLNALKGSIPVEKLALHLHDTRGTALANVVAGLEAGVRAFDSSAGGLGGCPYAPGASGNLATEDIVYMLHSMGVSTGIDLKKLVAASVAMESFLGRTLPSKVVAAEREVEK